MEKKYEIYGLKDPITNEIMYIGCSINVDARYRQHIYEANTGGNNSKKNKWIFDLLSNNKYPEIIILETITTSDRKKALNLESDYIKKYNLCFNKYEKDVTEKCIITFKIDEQLFKRFKMTTAYKGESATDVLTGFIRDYVIKNTANVNELMLEEWKNKINE